MIDRCEWRTELKREREADREKREGAHASCLCAVSAGTYKRHLPNVNQTYHKTRSDAMNQQRRCMIPASLARSVLASYTRPLLVLSRFPFQIETALQSSAANHRRFQPRAPADMGRTRHHARTSDQPTKRRDDDISEHGRDTARMQTGCVSVVAAATALLLCTYQLELGVLGVATLINTHAMRRALPLLLRWLCSQLASLNLHITFRLRGIYRHV